jgi:hypothetical protein
MIAPSLSRRITFARMTRPDILEEARRVVDGARAANVTVRVLGGVAISLHASGSLHPALTRHYRDIDLVTTRKLGRPTATLLTGLGYTANERFNLMNGSTRLVFYDLANERQLDVFVGEFRMCHQIPIADRLELEDTTVPLAELLLTKLQIVQLNDKDVIDIWAIVHEHDIAEHDDDAINAARIAELLSADWGLWRTSRQSVETARARLSESDLPVGDQSLIDDRLQRLWRRVETQPKGLRWRSRAKVGDRAKWYEEPEEIGHAVTTPSMHEIAAELAFGRHEPLGWAST